jgi:hypothetical protein
LVPGPSVVVGRREDLHAAAVVEATESLGGEPLLLDAESLGDADFLLDDNGVQFFRSDGEPDSLSGCRGWLRRLAPESWREQVVSDSHEGVVQQAWTTAIAVLVDLAGVRWLSDLKQIFAAEEKLVQLRACRDAGVSSPPTVLVTRRSRIPSEFGEELVVKPLASGHYRTESGEARVVFASPMRRDDPLLDLLAGAPFLIQPVLNARSHLRVVTVRQKAWVSELDSDSVSLDWRATAAAHSAFHPARYPEVAEEASKLAAKMRVGYSSQDWLVDQSGVAHFLDLNPAGQWLFLPNQVSEEVTLAIAEWLVSR